MGQVHAIQVSEWRRHRRKVWNAYAYEDGTPVGECWYCGDKLQLDGPWHVEHVIPRVEGGSDTLENLVPSCVDCNRRKGRKDIESFRHHEWKRRLRVIEDVFRIIRSVESYPDTMIGGCGTVELPDGTSMYPQDIVVGELERLHQWILEHGPRSVRFRGDPEIERFRFAPFRNEQEKLDHTTWCMMQDWFSRGEV